MILRCAHRHEIGNHLSVDGLGLRRIEFITPLGKQGLNARIVIASHVRMPHIVFAEVPVRPVRVEQRADFERRHFPVVGGQQREEAPGVMLVELDAHADLRQLSLIHFGAGIVDRGPDGERDVDALAESGLLHQRLCLVEIDGGDGDVLVPERRGLEGLIVHLPQAEVHRIVESLSIDRRPYRLADAHVAERRASGVEAEVVRIVVEPAAEFNPLRGLGIDPVSSGGHGRLSNEVQPAGKERIQPRARVGHDLDGQGVNVRERLAVRAGLPVAVVTLRAELYPGFPIDELEWARPDRFRHRAAGIDGLVRQDGGSRRLGQIAQKRPEAGHDVSPYRVSVDDGRAQVDDVENTREHRAVLPIADPIEAPFHVIPCHLTAVVELDALSEIEDPRLASAFRAVALSQDRFDLVCGIAGHQRLAHQSLDQEVAVAIELVRVDRGQVLLDADVHGPATSRDTRRRRRVCRNGRPFEATRESDSDPGRGQPLEERSSRQPA